MKKYKLIEIKYSALLNMRETIQGFINQEYCSPYEMDGEGEGDKVMQEVANQITKELQTKKYEGCRLVSY